MPSLTAMSRDKSRDFTFWLGRAYEDRAKVNLHMSWGHGLTGTSVTFGGPEGDDLTIGVKLYFFAFWLTFHGFIPWSWRRASYARAEARAARYAVEDRRARKRWEDAGRPGQAPPTRCHYAYEIDPMLGREFSVRIFGGSVWWALWHADHGWRSDDRRVWPWEGYGWTYTWPVVDWLLGKEQHDTTDLAVVETTVATDAHDRYPAAEYPAEAKLQLWRQWRTRWPFGREAGLRTVVTVEGGVPHPGKGTTSYNCEEDALFSQSGPLRSLTWQEANAVLFNDADPAAPGWVGKAALDFADQVTWYRTNYPR